jgi:hypothetical protein
LQKKVGILPRDNSNGPFIDEWKKIYGDISKDVEEVDIASALSAAALAVKDENELVRKQVLPKRDVQLTLRSACNAKRLQSMYRSHESILCRRDVKYSRRREEGET